MKREALQDTMKNKIIIMFPHIRSGEIEEKFVVINAIKILITFLRHDIKNIKHHEISEI